MSSEVRTASLGDFFSVLRRRWRVLSAIVLLSLALSAAFVALSPPRFESRSVVKVNPLDADPLSSDGDSDVSTVTEAQVVASTSVAERVALELGPGVGAAGLLERVEVSSPLGSQLLEITFADRTAAGAAKGANAFAQAYLDYRRDTAAARVQERVDRLGEQRALLQRQAGDAEAALSQQVKDAATRDAEIRAVRAAAARQSDVLEGQIAQLRVTQINPGDLVDRGGAPRGDGRPSLLPFLAGGLLAGLVVGAVVALWRHRSDDRIAGAEDLAAAAAVPVLATLTAGRAPGRRAHPQATATQPDYPWLGGRLLSTLRAHDAQRVLLVSPGHGAAEAVPADLAAALSQQGLKVLLVGCSPAASTYPGNGLARTEGRGWGTRLWRPGAAEAVTVLDLGPEGRVQGLLHHDTAALDDLLRAHEVVIVDAVNVDDRSTVLSLARLAQQAVVLVEQWHTTRAQVDQAQSDLSPTGLPVVGTVLVGPDLPSRPTMAPVAADVAGQGTASSAVRPTPQHDGLLRVAGRDTDQA